MPLRCQLPPWKVANTGIRNSLPTATEASKRGDSYSWQRIAQHPARRISRAKVITGVAR